MILHKWGNGRDSSSSLSSTRYAGNFVPRGNSQEPWTDEAWVAGLKTDHYGRSYGLWCHEWFSFSFFYEGVLCPVLLFFGMELGLAPYQAKAECSNDSAKWNMENTSIYSAGFKISIFITISLIRSKFGLIRSKFLQGKLLSSDLDALCDRVYLRNCRLYIYML